MNLIKQEVPISFHYPVHFTNGLFKPGNNIFADLVKPTSAKNLRKVLFIIDKGMYKHNPRLFEEIESYSTHHKSKFKLISSPVFIPGGEKAKNDFSHIRKIRESINQADLDRHSYVTTIGGGAVIDTAGYAAATVHRGIRMIRIPTTVLAQNDAAVGVKNGINAFGKKNFLGTFTPPYAVLNDANFLNTLDDRDWRSGISEAIKVALLKDAHFFSFLEKQAPVLNDRDEAAMQQLIYRCAELHLNHIATSGDPFEMGSSRPLDFGHWSAHKLEQLTDYKLRHGEAVAIGIALDVVYSHLQGMLSKTALKRVLDTLQGSGFQLYVPELNSKPKSPEHEESIFHGLEEFREHLGGELTIMLLKEIGQGIEVHNIVYDQYRKAISFLESYAN